MRILFCWVLTSVTAFAAGAMAVVEETVAVEAAEVAETVRRTEKEEAVKPPKSVDLWEAFEPPPDSSFDWLQLTSGEWPQGDFKVLYDYKLEFDLDVFLIWGHIQKPQAAADGSIPKQNDLQLIVSLAYDF